MLSRSNSPSSHNELGPFTFYPTYGVVICARCQVACLGGEVLLHLRTKHKDLPVAVRKEVTAAVVALPGVVQSEASRPGPRLPPPTALPVPELGPPQTGAYACDHCGRIYLHLKRIEAHARTEHAWEHPVKARGSNAVRHATDTGVRPWRGGVFCQRFFRNRPGACWFEVQPPSTPTASPPPGSPRTAATAALEARFAEAVKEAADHRTATVVQPGHRFEPNPWLDRTGWARHLEGLDARVLLGAVSLNAQDGWAGGITDESASPYALQQVWESLNRLVVRAQAVATVAGRPVLFELRKRAFTAPASVPFDGQMLPSTRTRYCAIWQRILAFVWRTQLWIPNVDPLPPYELTSDQADAIDALFTLSVSFVEGDPPRPSQLAALDQAVLRLCLCLLAHPLEGSPYESALLSALAVRAIQPSASGAPYGVVSTTALESTRDEAGFRWRSAADTTPVYSGVIKVARLLTLLAAYEACPTAPVALTGVTFQPAPLPASHAVAPVDLAPVFRPPPLPDNSPGPVGSEPPVPKRGLFTVVRRLVELWLTVAHPGNYPSPIDWLFQTRAYGMRTAAAASLSARIQWTGERIQYLDVAFTMPQFVSMVQTLTLELGRTMAELLFLSPGEPLPPVDIASLRDRPNESRPTYTFLTDPLNTRLQHGHPDCRTVALSTRVARTEALRTAWFKPGGEPRRSALIRYNALLEAFRVGLLLLMHLTGGQPARTTELLSVRHRNTPYGGARNVFLWHGLVSFTTSYHKGYENSKRLKVVQRFLPDEVGSQLVRYLWLVLPFWEALHRVTERRTGRSDFLFAADLLRDPAAEATEQLWTGDKLRRSLEDVTVRLLQGNRVNVQMYRHIAISISRQFLQGDFKDTSTTPYDGGAGSEDESEDEACEAAVWARQAAHSLRTDLVVYARETQQLFSSTSLEQERFRRISVLWHRFLGFPSARLSLPVAAPFPYEAARESARRYRLQGLRATPLIVPLRAMLACADAAFRGQQADVLESIVRGQTPILYVASTSEGKSLAFFLPAYAASEGVTIVVVPLIALQGDLAQRADTYRIESTVYTYGAPAPARLLFVTPETVGTDAFLGFVHQLSEAQQLDRVVVDEAHLVLDASPAFRPALLALGRTVAVLGVQFILLTATLPPRDMPMFAERTGIDLARTAVFRGATVRPQLQYAVRLVRTAEEEADQVVARVQTLMDAHPGRPAVRVIVYALTVATVVSLAERLACPAYYAKAGTSTEKAALLDTWRRTGGPIVATNALGLGLDVPDVRAVLHAGAPRNLRDYAQESGRCSRDGTKGACLLFTAQPRRLEGGQTEDEESNLAAATMDDYIHGTYGCRRVVLDAVLDGRTDRRACESGEVACDLCRRRGAFRNLAPEPVAPPPRSTEAALDAEHQRVALYYQEAFARRTDEAAVRSASIALRFLQRGLKACVACLAYNPERQYHSSQACPLPSHDPIRTALRVAGPPVVQWLQGLRLAPYAGCTTCLLPQAWCPSWEAAAEDGGRFSLAHPGQCYYRTALLGVFTYVQAIAPLRTAFLEAAYEVLEQHGYIASQRNGNIWSLPEAFLQSRLSYGNVELSGLSRVLVLAVYLTEERIGVVREGGFSF